MRMKLFFSIVIFCFYADAFPQDIGGNMHYRISMPEPSKNYYMVELTFQDPGDTAVLKMCAWTPGGYSLIDYASNLDSFFVTDASGKSLAWSKPSKNNWQVLTGGAKKITVHYRIHATRSNIEGPYIDEHQGLI